MSAADEAKPSPAIPNSCFISPCFISPRQDSACRNPIERNRDTHEDAPKIISFWAVSQLAGCEPLAAFYRRRTGNPSKTIDLAACDTVFNADEAKCILAARTAETICVNNEEQAFKNAEFVRDAAMNIALVTYVIAYGGCFYTLNLPCLYGINVAYAVALAGIPINYAREVKIAQKTAETCSSNWAATLTNCRKAADNDRAKCIKIANDNCARCKNNCGGDNGGG